MENVEYPFKHEVLTPTSSKNIIKISGAFRRGNLSSEQLRDIETAIEKAKTLTNNGVLLIFDLLGLTYWDTLGINTVINAIKEVNEKHTKRAGMVLKKESVAYEAAYGRHSKEFDSGRVLFAESEEALLEARAK